MSGLALRRRVLIVGEGRETEYNYFVGLRNAFQEVLAATATSVRVARGKGGGASDIVKTADKEARKFGLDRKRGDRVFLLLDTEGARRAAELPKAEKLASARGIEIIYSCPCFEYWLLCHFRNVPRSHFEDCRAVGRELDKSRRWKRVCKDSYRKDDPDVFDRVANLLDEARSQALTIDLQHLQTSSAARAVNPSTQVYELVGILIGAWTNEKCPISDTWRLVGDASVAIQINRGDAMPAHKGMPVHWQI